jgi:hypothetical protein
MEIKDLVESMIKQFVEDLRPPVEIREELDIVYTYANQTLEIGELRPRWDKPQLKTITPVAKATFVKSRDIWKVYWKRASGKWDPYTPKPEVKHLDAFFKLLKEDKHHCFWG